MNAWLRALRAERLKVRHTLALWMVLLTPLAIALLVVLQFTVVAHHMPGHHATTAAKAWFAVGKSMFGLWCVLMLPLFVTLETALLAGLEHGNAQWKHLQALPLPRGAHYLGKWSMGILMVLVAYIILFALVPVAGWVLSYTGPAFGIAGAPALGPLAGPAAGSLAACVLMVSVQTWVALRWRSFTVAVSVGIVAMVAGFLIGRSNTWGKFYPWSMPMQAFSDSAHNATTAIWIGLAGGLAIALLGMYDYLRRDSF